MSKAALLELADRVEKASGSDRELDVAITIATCVVDSSIDPRSVEDMRADDFDPGWVLYRANGENYTDCAKSFTASLDAAMTLLGRNAIQSLSYWPFVAKGYESELCCRLTLIEVTQDGFGGKHHFRADAKTPALALTAAALRARAQQESSDADQ